MAVTFTPNLKLAVDSNLTANAKANLAKIDTLGGVFTQTAAGTTLVRGIEDIQFLPNNADVGGTGSGGSIVFGSANQTLDSVLFYVSSIDYTGTIGLKDKVSSSYLRLEYDSSVSGSPDTADRKISFDLEGADRTMVLGANLSIGATTLGLGANTYTFPAGPATLVDLSSSQTLASKTISGASNTLSNIAYSSLILTTSIVDGDISPSAAIAYSKISLINSITNADINSAAAIAYSKLALTNSITNADIASAAAIAGTKISPNFGSLNVRTEGQLQVALSPTVSSNFQASPSQVSDISYTLPAVAPTTNQLLSYDGSELTWINAGGGTVTSVGLSLGTTFDAIASVSSSPITTSGNIGLELDTQAANLVFAGPSTGGATEPTFRSLVADDIPTLTVSKLSDFNSAWDTRLGTKSTTDLAEGTNLYYTTSRVNTAFDNRLALKSTTDLAEGTNLYYTQSRFDSALGAKSTTDLAEGTNLYYTNTRADARITLQKGAANGLATLDGGGKVPASQLPSTVMEYKGNWNASTNSPTLADGVGDTGDIYRANATGTQNLGSGPITFQVGDWVVYNGTIWEKSTNSNAVLSVNGFTGAVSLSTTDIGEGVNLYYTQARFNTAFGLKSTSDLTEGTNLYFTNGRVDTQLATYKFPATWAPGDGTSKAITHNFATNDIYYNVYDIDTGEEIWPDTATRTTTNILTLTSSQAPTGSGWRVVVRK